LGIRYNDDLAGLSLPFLVGLRRSDPVHLLDSHTLGIVLAELDTFRDFVSYIAAKEQAISRYDYLSYCGEEDLLGHYFQNYDVKAKQHFIGTKDKHVKLLHIEEGTWVTVRNSAPYLRKKEADAGSYLWDDLIQKTAQNALDGRMSGNSDIYNSRVAIFEMAKEPRFIRRALADRIRNAIANFPYGQEGIVRDVSFTPSYYRDKAYIFLQVRCPEEIAGDYDTEYRPRRRALLEIACGVARNKLPYLKKVIGIAIDAPKDKPTNSEDFLLMETEDWPDEHRQRYEDANKKLKFFETRDLKICQIHVQNFPAATKVASQVKIGRNAPCPCGSGRKFKRCHGG
jgi:hypothetical protein